MRQCGAVDSEREFVGGLGESCETNNGHIRFVTVQFEEVGLHM